MAQFISASQYSSVIRNLIFLFIFTCTTATGVLGQRTAKYGADFLAGGVGARALGMGGAYVAIADDANAGYWNPAGLDQIVTPEFAYMHAERFAGAVSFDYLGVAWPLSAKSTLGASFYRSGVNDIYNTLDAWDAVRNQPKPNPTDFITTFSAADYAFFFGYGRRISDELSIGFTGKIVRRTIGSFADAWGYSLDVGAQYRSGPWAFGLNLQDLTTMLQSWSINKEALANIRDVFGDDLPTGGTELVLPVARLGSAYHLDFESSRILFALDMDVAFDGQQANALNVGNASFHPRAGIEYMIKDLVSLRAGMSSIRKTEKNGWDITPSVGAGFRVKQFQFDYGFGDFGGLVSELGYSHRISLEFSLSGDRFKRPDSD